MTDEFVEPKPGDVFTCDEALSLAVCGYRVRAKDMQEGAFVDYNFAGWRINFPGGSSSGWHARDIDYAAEWEVVEDAKPEPEPVVPKWGFTPGKGKPTVDIGVTAAWTKDDRGKWQGQGGTVDPAQPAPPASVGKWGSPQPAKDKWGRPS